MRVRASVCKLTSIQYWIARVPWERGCAPTLLQWVISFGSYSSNFRKSRLLFCLCSFLSIFWEHFFLQLICWSAGTGTPFFNLPGEVNSQNAGLSVRRVVSRRVSWSSEVRQAEGRRWNMRNDIPVIGMTLWFLNGWSWKSLSSGVAGRWCGL
jgi:hypothetical protein